VNNSPTTRFTPTDIVAAREAAEQAANGEIAESVYTDPAVYERAYRNVLKLSRTGTDRSEADQQAKRFGMDSDPFAGQ